MMMLDADAESECEDSGTFADGPFVQYPTYVRIYTLMLSPAILGVPCALVPSVLPCYLQPIYIREGFCVCIAIGALPCNCYA